MNQWSTFVLLYSIYYVSVFAGISSFNSTLGSHRYYEDGLKLSCQRPMRLTDVFSPSNVTLVFPDVTIAFCIPKSYFEELRSLNINASAIERLRLTFIKVSLLQPGNYTQGLQIRSLWINYFHQFPTSVFQNVQNFLEPLTKLESLYVDGRVDMPPLPKTIELIHLTLMKGASIKNWGNCHHLETIEIIDFYDYERRFEYLEWPQRCTRLKSLTIKNMFSKFLPIVMKKMIAAAPNLLKLTITECNLDELPTEMIQFIRLSVNLTYLDLARNKLDALVIRSIPFHKPLKTLNISNNMYVDGHAIVYVLLSVPTLSELVMKDLSPIFPRPSFAVRALQRSFIEFLDFGTTRYNLNLFYNLTFSSLKHMSLHSPEAEDDDLKVDLKVLQLPKTGAGHLTMDFGNFTFRTIWFHKNDYETLRRENSTFPYNGHNLTVLLKTIKCDCDAGWLARALRDYPHIIISMPHLQCDNKNGVKLLDIPRNILECNETEREGWFYTQIWVDGSVTAKCDKKAWMKMTPVYPLHGLNASGQGINTLHTYLPQTLQWLDLRHNLITRASAEEAAALFAAGRRVWLADNLLLCDCDNRALLDAIQLHKDQVQDYDLLKCVGSEQSVSSISTAALCQVALIVSLSMAGVLVVVAGLIAVLVRRYGEQLRMFLYSRGWCITCLQRQDDDDKPYDAFISFAHEDREYVMETLLPGLENAPEKFRVCVHYRDWLVGDWIPAQIMRSVQLSKRTLIVLSRNFVTSVWSTLELRYSLSISEKEADTKVLFLIKDDVLEMDLAKELRGYLTFNTYLRCDDQWFWEKLRYAMPHRVQTITTKTEDIHLQT